MALTPAIDWVKRRWSRGGMIAVKLLSGLGILLIFGGLVAAVLTWPGVRTHHEAVRNLGLVVAGMIAIPLAVWRTVVAQRQAETARRSLLNERDQKAAEMLGSALLSVRLGGIYALQTLAAEHPPHYHLGVMRQFCAFVRSPPSPPNSTAAGLAHVPVGEDVRAVMGAISTRSDAGIAIEQEEKGFRLDLVGVNLSGVNLRKANLSGADLSGADLSRVILLGANLSGANLSGADLSGVILSKTNLSRADLSRANLSRANLWDTDLSGADLSGADLSGADLSGVNLSRVNLSRARLSEGTVITQEQLDNTVAVSTMCPIFMSAGRDAKTGDPLEWRGPTA